jgi:membrane protease YdiL (CAAX protease family)
VSELTLIEFIAVAIQVAPLFIALDIVPIIIAGLVHEHVMRKCLLRVQGGGQTKVQASLQPLLAPQPAQIHGSMSSLYTFGVFTILVAPFVEEFIFRGMPILIHPALAWVGTVGWALAHPVKSMGVADTCPQERKLVFLDMLALAGAYLCAGVFYMIIWLHGFVYGAVAIAYHSLHNMIMFFSFLVSEKYIRFRPRKMEKRKVQEPIIPLPPAPPATPARRILRYVGLENSVLPMTGESAEATKIEETIYLAREFKRRALRRT